MKIDNFNIGDKVKVEDFFGRVIRMTEVTEITPSGNIRVKGHRGLFKPSGVQRRKCSTWTDKIFIKKIENEEDTINGNR